MRRCAPGGGEALNWSRIPRLVRTSHPPSRPRGENTRLLRARRLLRRGGCRRSGRQNRIRKRHLHPSVFRAAERRPGQGRIDRIDRRAGSTRRSRSHSLPTVAKHRTSPETSCRRRRAAPGNGTRPKEGFRASQIITLESLRATTAARASSAAQKPHGKCRCSALPARRDGHRDVVTKLWRSRICGMEDAWMAGLAADRG